MYEIFNRLKKNPALFTKIIIASFFVNILALATPIYVIQVLQRYVAYGVSSTLVTLVAGITLVMIFEFFFRNIRHRMTRETEAENTVLADRVMKKIVSILLVSVFFMGCSEDRVLIDELTNIKKLFSATAIVNVKKDSFFVQGHFPGEPVMPGVLIVEAFGQAAAALTAHGLDKSTYENKLVFLMSVEKARFRNPVIPDCKLELKIEAIRSHGRVWKYKGEAFVDEKKMADAQWSATIVDRK